MESNEESIAKLGCCLIVLLFNSLVGAWSVNYLLSFFLGKTIPFLGALVIGMVAGEISIPVAIVVAVLKFFHIL